MMFWSLMAFVVVLSWCPIRTRSEVYSMCEREGEIAFTYDQGPSQYTGRLLVTLAKHKIKATFHVSPDYLGNPVILAYLRKAALDGHLIGIFVKEEVGEEDLKGYLDSSSAIIKRYTNYQPQYLRFTVPGPTEGQIKTATALGYIVTTYNLDSQDYNAVNTSENDESVFNVYRDIFDQILPPAMGSFIAIQRDIVRNSVEQSDAIIQYALDKGYRPVRLDQCLRRQASDAKNGEREGQRQSQDGTTKARANDLNGHDQNTSDGAHIASGNCLLTALSGLVFAGLFILF